MLKKEFYSSSLFLTIVYTVGHIFIAMICNTIITGANLKLATLDALIEPIVNGVWFYILHKFYQTYLAVNNTLSK